MNNKLERADLEKIPCPDGLGIEIQDLGKMRANLPLTLGAAIGHIYVCFTGKPILDMEAFLNRVTVVDNNIPRSLKVRIAPN